MSLDSQLPPDRSNTLASIIGHGSVAGLGAVVGGFYGLGLWQNGGSNMDYVRSTLFCGAIALTLSLTYLKYEWKHD